jgi:hypothetical protein
VACPYQCIEALLFASRYTNNVTGRSNNQKEAALRKAG